MFHLNKNFLSVPTCYATNVHILYIGNAKITLNKYLDKELDEQRYYIQTTRGIVQLKLGVISTYTGMFYLISASIDLLV